jgi:hypothetical protein
VKARAYRDADAAAWDALVERCPHGTFLHTRRFLSYHRDRFADCSVLCDDGKGRLCAVFPAALKPDDPGCVVSHPGATYGGLVCRPGSGADAVAGMLAGIADHYRERGLRRLEYRCVPPHLHASYSQADQHALWRNGAELYRRDLWNVLSLGARPPAYSTHHQRAVARARRDGVSVRATAAAEDYHAFHGMLTARLEDRYGVAPVHTPGEMCLLQERFPENIGLWLAEDAGASRLLAGCWVFVHAGRAWHTQYIAATPEGRERCATHLLFDGVIRAAAGKGAGFVSFGCSTESGGREVNRGLFDFKTGFGAGAVCHDFYRLPLASKEGFHVERG